MKDSFAGFPEIIPVFSACLSPKENITKKTQYE